MSFRRFTLFFPFLILPFFLNAQHQEEFVLSGVYNGRNLYVQNPLSSNMKDYCTREVWVNDTKVFTNPRTSAFTVNLSHLNEQTPVTIRIVHNAGCAPKVINPQVIRTLNKFKFLTIHVDSARLEWVTSGELSSGKFFVEKWDNNRWEPVRSLQAEGAENSRYEIVVEHHSGENRYRIKYLQNDGESFYSSVQKYIARMEPITFAPTRVSDKIYLSKETDYIVKDPKGNQLLKGHGKEINLGHLTTGLYYLVFDNRTEKFFKK